MKKITLLICLFSFLLSFSQSTIEGFIFDKESKTSLPYATIKIISNNNYYTITNEDGKFEIYDRFALDSLEIRFIGFKTKKVPVTYFKEHSKFYLSPNILALNEVLVIANKNENYAYDLLNSLIQKYRNKKLVIESKGFLTLTSSARGIPIEIIEGFYNSEQNLSKGIVDLKIKSGRFGQNKSFPFYSLNNTDILMDFQLFKKATQILPLYPGNMTFSAFKGKYDVKINECNLCNYEDLLISFIPKKFNGRLFSGNIIFNKKTLTIKKIELRVADPITNGLSSIIENDIMTPKEIKLNINFNPIDFEKIQSLDFEFIMQYKSKKNIEMITSHSFLYFYDYYEPFEEPYFTNNISFNNDYDKIIALQASDEFWNSNYQFPKSFSEKRAISFLKKYGSLINYENSIPKDDMKYTKPSVIAWNKNKRLEWGSIKHGLDINKKEHNFTNRDNNGENIKADKVFHSVVELKNNDNDSGKNQEFNFGYILDTYKIKNGNKQFITRTLFDRGSSFCKYSRITNKLIYINLVFDIYEYHRQNLNSQINNKMTLDEVKIMCEDKFKEASLIVKKMKNETNYGLNYKNLIRWNTTIKHKLNSND